MSDFPIPQKLRFLINVSLDIALLREHVTEVIGDCHPGPDQITKKLAVAV